MSADGRSWAWLVAWQMTKQAEKLRTDQKGQLIDPPPEMYWGWLTEAKIFAQLATADLAVGIDAGAWLSAEEKREAESLVRREEFEEAMKLRKDDLIRAAEDSTPTYPPGAVVRVVGGEDVPDWMCSAPATIHEWNGSKYRVLVRNQSGVPWYVWLTPEQVEAAQPQEDT